MLSNVLRIYMMVPRTQVLGPHLRFALWVQGCPFSCPGCMTPDAQPFDGGEELTVASLSCTITAESAIEGITISGGEPFCQAEPLASLIAAVKEVRELGIIIYTGYRLNELQHKAGSVPGIRALLELTDILIDGPYVESLNDGLSLRGSANQVVHQLTGRYNAIAGQYYGKPQRSVELHNYRDHVVMTGIPGAETLHKWKNNFS